MILLKETSIKLLKLLITELEKLGLFPVIGAEIEFYLKSPNNMPLNNVWQAEKLEIDINIESEKGPNQFEVRTIHSRDVLASAQEIVDLKEKISAQALKQNMVADFSAKPIIDSPGNALHIHLHLENDKGENLYIKQGDKDADIFLHSIGGLCANLHENMFLFAPYNEAYSRYLGKAVDVPSKICWGGNNRSAAIRIPLDQKYNRRLEHRVSCADACPFEVIGAILFGVLQGINKRITPPEKLFGNAFLEQYEFPLLPNYEQAKEAFSKSEFLAFTKIV